MRKTPRVQYNTGQGRGRGRDREGPVENESLELMDPVGSSRVFSVLAMPQLTEHERISRAFEAMAEVEGEEEEEEEEEYPVPQYPLHEAVAVQPSPMGGSGLFALRDFAQGDGERRKATEQGWG